jgi:hypothetical protein
MRRFLLRLLAEGSPLFLLSALSMLVGCYTLSHALALQPGQTSKLLVLLATLNVYEALVIGLGLFLIVRRRRDRDGRLLLLLEVLFLADATLLNGEAFAADFTMGARVSAVALMLAFLKLIVILRVLSRGTVVRALAPMAMPLALLYVTPGAFARLEQLHLLAPASVYTAWWVAALTVVVQAVIARQAAASAAPKVDPAPSALRRALAIALPASLTVHLVAAAWVYHVDFRLAYLGPMLLALGVARILLDVSWPGPSWRLALPAAAIVASLGSPADLVVNGPWSVPISPLRAVLVGAGLAYFEGYRLHRAASFAWGAGLCLLGAVSGHTVGAMATSGGRLWRWLTSGGRRVVPRTAEGWGVVAVAMAFVLLGLGAAASLLSGGLRPPEPPGRGPRERLS